MCVKCGVEFIPQETGVYVEELSKAIGSYRVWMADVKKCPVCDFEIIYGYGDKPVASHFDKDYVDHLAKLAPKYQIKEHIRR
jgi:hypothetical protein